MTYTICELNNNASAGWTQEWQVDTDGDGVADATIPAYNPEEIDDPMMPDTRLLMCRLRCGHPVHADARRRRWLFEVNNQFPGGEPRTPGYWKNWSSCINGGNQYVNATGDNDPNNEFCGVGRVARTIPGLTSATCIWAGSPIQTGRTPTATAAVDILDHRDMWSGKKRANDCSVRPGSEPAGIPAERGCRCLPVA